MKTAHIRAVAKESEEMGAGLIIIAAPIIEVFEDRVEQKSGKSGGKQTTAGGHE
jgi:hypothetical protein